MIFIFIPCFLCAFGIAWYVCGRVGRGTLLDDAGSESHKTHTGTMPTGGGLGIWLGVLGTFALASLALPVVSRSEEIAGLFPKNLTDHLPGLAFRLGSLWTLLGLGSVLAVLGTLDDRYKLGWKRRLFVQFLVATATVLAGFRFSVFGELSFGGDLLGVVVSVLWIVGLTNSFNMLDNMDGLSAGVAAICCVFFAAAMFLAPQTGGPQLFVCGFLCVLLGALCGFLTYNNPFRTRLFMGDGGAYFIGFLLAATTLTATFADSGAVSRRQTLFVPLLILAVPLYDTFTVVRIRLREGRSPFAGDKNHFSHRLVTLGLSRRDAVLTIYLVTTICCIGAILLYQVDFAGAVLITLQTALMLALVAILENQRKK